MDEQKKPSTEFIPVVPRAYTNKGEEIPLDQLDPEQIPELYKQNAIGFSNDDDIPVVGPTGSKLNVKGSQVSQALSQGYEIYTPDKQYKDYLEKKFGDSEGTAFTEGALRGATLGLSDVIAEKTGLTSEEAIKARQEYNPISAGAGEFAGIIAPSVATGGANLLGEGAAGATIKSIASYTPSELVLKAGRAVEGAVASKVGALEASSIAAKIARSAAPKVVGSALEGAMFQGGQAISEEMLGDPDLNAQYILSQAGEGLVFGGGLGAVLGGAEVAKPYLEKSFKSAAESSQKAAKNALSTFLGVSKDDLERYVANKDAVNSIDNAAEHLDELKGKYFDKINAEQDFVGGLDQEARLAKEKQRDILSETNKDYAGQKYQAGLDLSAAKNDFSKVEDELLSKSRADLNPVGQKVVSSLEDLRNGAILQSQAITEGLEGAKLDVKSVHSAIHKIADDVEAYGTEYHKGVAGKIRSYADDMALEAVDGKLDALDVKKRIQGLDQITSYNPSASAFDKAENSAMKQVRYELDDLLKSKIDGYRKAMAPVAEDFKLLKQLNKFSDDSTVAGRLAKASSDPLRQEEMTALRQLEKRTGGDFVKGIEDYSSREQLVANTAEAKKVKQLEELNATLKDPRNKEKVIESLKDSPDFKKLVDTVDFAERAKLSLDGISDITPRGVESIFKRAGRGDSIAIGQVRRLEEYFAHEGLSEEIKNLGIKSAFEKGFQHGSKNTLMWGTLGSVVGHALGAGPLAGGLGGAIWGGIVDRHGPKIAKMLLDKYAAYAAMEKQGINVAAKMIDHLNGFLGSKNIADGIKEKGLQIRGAGLKEGVESYSDQSRDKKLKKLKEIQKATNDFSQNDSVLFDTLKDDQKFVSQYAPNIGQQMDTRRADTIRFVSMKLPKDPLAGYYANQNNSQWEPSDAQLSSFFRTYEAAVDPLSVFKSLKDGDLTVEHVSTLKTLYPKLYEDASMYLAENLAQTKELPYDKKLSASLFTDQPLDPSLNPSFIMQTQALLNNSQVEQSAQGQQGLLGPVKLDKNLGMSAMSQAQRIEYRKMT